MMYRACIFDLDGTLTDTLKSITYSVNATLEEMKLSVITSEQCQSFIGHGARYLLEEALKVSGDEGAFRIEEALKIYGRIFDVNCTYNVVLYEGIENMIQELKDRNLKLAVLSNKPHMQTKCVVETFFSKETFAIVQGQQEGVPRKPDPTAVWRIADQLGVSREECLYIGDSDVDMITAKEAGMTSVGVTWGFRPKEMLLECGAHYTIDYPQELMTILQSKEK